MVSLSEGRTSAPESSCVHHSVTPSMMLRPPDARDQCTQAAMSSVPCHPFQLDDLGMLAVQGVSPDSRRRPGGGPQTRGTGRPGRARRARAAGCGAAPPHSSAARRPAPRRLAPATGPPGCCAHPPAGSANTTSVSQRTPVHATPWRTAWQHALLPAAVCQAQAPTPSLATQQQSF